MESNLRHLYRTVVPENTIEPIDCANQHIPLGSSNSLRSSPRAGRLGTMLNEQKRSLKVHAVTETLHRG